METSISYCFHVQALNELEYPEKLQRLLLTPQREMTVELVSYIIRASMLLVGPSLPSHLCATQAESLAGSAFATRFQQTDFWQAMCNHMVTVPHLRVCTAVILLWSIRNHELSSCPESTQVTYCTHIFCEKISVHTMHLVGYHSFLFLIVTAGGPA